MAKPGIIHLPHDNEEPFVWVSDGWNEIKVRHTPKAKGLFTKACKAIADAKDTKDAIKRLKAAGFTVTTKHPSP